MNLPNPRETLAGCVWLPRIIAKARLLARGELPPEYVARFGHPSGVDGQFLAYFRLTKEEIVEAATRSNEDVVRWFETRPANDVANVERWNEIAVNLGRPGYPMAERFPIALASTYQHLQARGFTTVFEVLEADEQQP